MGMNKNKSIMAQNRAKPSKARSAVRALPSRVHKNKLKEENKRACRTFSHMKVQGEYQ